MRSAVTFLVVLLLLLLALSAYVQIVLVGKLPFEPSTISDIVGSSGFSHFSWRRLSFCHGDCFSDGGANSLRRRCWWHWQSWRYGNTRPMQH